MHNDDDATDQTVEKDAEERASRIDLPLLLLLLLTTKHSSLGIVCQFHRKLKIRNTISAKVIITFNHQLNRYRRTGQEAPRRYKRSQFPWPANSRQFLLPPFLCHPFLQLTVYLNFIVIARLMDFQYPLKSQQSSVRHQSLWAGGVVGVEGLIKLVIIIMFDPLNAGFINISNIY